MVLTELLQSKQQTKGIFSPLIHQTARAARALCCHVSPGTHGALQGTRWGQHPPFPWGAPFCSFLGLPDTSPSSCFSTRAGAFSPSLLHRLLGWILSLKPSTRPSELSGTTGAPGQVSQAMAENLARKIYQHKCFFFFFF